MKKVALLTILLLVTMPLVQGKMTPISSDGYDHEVETYVNVGWNLVLGTFNIDGTISEKSEVGIENIKTVFAYLPSLGKYLNVYPGTEFRDYEKNIAYKEYFYISFASFWIYSNKEGYLRYNRIDVLKFHQVSLYKGWNFITLTPELKFKKIKEFKGACEITKIAVRYYNGEWQVVTPETYMELTESGDRKSWGDIVLVDSDSDVGKGMLIKVKADCALGYGEGATNPPPFPE